jgi:hypothetical protein
LAEREKERWAPGTALSLKDRRTNYWFEYLPDSKTVFFQYNGVQNIPKDPLPEFCDRLFKSSTGTMSRRW